MQEIIFRAVATQRFHSHSSDEERAVDAVTTPGELRTRRVKCDHHPDAEPKEHRDNRDLAQQEGMDAAVWHAGPELLQIYGDLGLTALPLGANGLPIPESEGDTPKASQYLVCKAERDLNLLLPILPSLAQERRVTDPIALVEP